MALNSANKQNDSRARREAPDQFAVPAEATIAGTLSRLDADAAAAGPWLGWAGFVHLTDRRLPLSGVSGLLVRLRRDKSDTDVAAARVITMSAASSWVQEPLDDAGRTSKPAGPLVRVGLRKAGQNPRSPGSADPLPFGQPTAR